MSDPTREISVTGVGEVTAPPDVVTIDLGVSVLEPTVALASGSAASAAGALIAALEGQGVDRDDIATVNYTIAAEYDWSENQRRLLGFRVNNTVRARIRELARASEVLDTAVAAAGDTTQVNTLQFSIDDNRAPLAAAREAAWLDAVSRAEQLAGLSGSSLGPALSIVETVPGHPGPLPMARLRLEAADVSTPIEGGSATVGVTLQVRFALDS